MTFDAKTSATPEPHVRLQCKLDGALVYSADAGMYASYPWPWEQDMTLSSSLWTSGGSGLHGSDLLLLRLSDCLGDVAELHGWCIARHGTGCSG